MIRQTLTLVLVLFALVLAPLRGMGDICAPDTMPSAAACGDMGSCCATMACCIGSSEAPKPEPASTPHQNEGAFAASLAASSRSLLYTLPSVPAAYPVENISFSAHALAPLAASGVMLL